MLTNFGEKIVLEEKTEGTKRDWDDNIKIYCDKNCVFY
jgi:hypothetical protein